MYGWRRPVGTGTRSERNGRSLLVSGRSGSGARIESLLADGLSSMPFHGDPRSVPIPGCVDGWLALHKRFGRLNLETVLEDAISPPTVFRSRRLR